MGDAGQQLNYPTAMPAIYYVPGRGGRLNVGLGQELSQLAGMTLLVEKSPVQDHATNQIHLLLYPFSNK